jgi:gamma-glutamyltranspeptidase/glutathione hydrolase
MSENLSKQVRFIKRAVRGRGGAVAAKNQAAADLGARILSEGGNAVDSAIAVAFALAVLEPWTSGLGSAGCMTIWDQEKHRGIVIDFPAALPSQRPPAEPVWPGPAERSGGNALAAYKTIAVPGQPEGLWAAHLFGTKPWTALVSPAIEVSEQGLEFDWYAYLAIGLAAADLARSPGSREWFLPPDLPASYLNAKFRHRFRNPALTATLKLLAERGGRDFYEGVIAYALEDDLMRGGSAITKDDLRAYRARVIEPGVFARGSKRYLFPPDRAMANTFCNIMKSEDHIPAYVDSKRMIDLAHSFSAAYSELQRPGTDAGEWSSHVSVIDGHGNMASLSQTLGSLFGSRIVLRNTGILANNHAAEAEQQASASVTGGFAAHNLLPIVGLSGERALLALGVAGDRHILPTVIQLISLLDDFGYSLEDAFHHPRISICKSGLVQVDATASPDIKTALAQIFQTVEVPTVVFPFARPCAVAVHVDYSSGERVAITEATELWAGAAAIA